MKYIYAAFLLRKLRKELNEENVKKVVAAAGIEIDEYKVKSLDELRKIRKKRKNEFLVFVSGCFDIIHADHVEYLAWARTLGDYLLVAINSDNSIRQLKGPTRPIIPLKNRIQQIAANQSVDYIIVFNELETIKIIETLKPDIFARGKDSVLDKRKIKEGKKEMNQNERRSVESYEGKIYFLDKPPKYSTSQLIKTIKNGY